MGSGVNINYDEMHQILNEEREGSSGSDDDNGGGGGGGQEDIPVPEVMIQMRRGRRSSSGAGQLVTVKGKFHIND